MHSISIDEQLLAYGDFSTIRGQRRLLCCLMPHVGLTPQSSAAPQHRCQRHASGECSCIDKVTNTEPQGTGGGIESYRHAHYLLLPLYPSLVYYTIIAAGVMTHTTPCSS